MTKTWICAPVVVDADAARALAEAVDGVVAGEHADGEAPPVSALLASAGAWTAPLFDPDADVDLMRVVHHDVDAVFAAPVRIGAALTSTARVGGRRDTAAGTIVSFDVEIKDELGVVVCRATNGLFMRRSRAREDQEARAAERAAADAAFAALPQAASSTSAVHRARVAAFVRAARDPNPMYVDDDAARTANLPGAIVPPLLAAAIAHHAIARAAGTPPSALRRLVARFGVPALVGATLAVCVRGDAGGRRARATTDDGARLVVEVAA